MRREIHVIEQVPWRLQITVARLIVSSAFLGAGAGCLLAAFSVQQSWSDWRRLLAFLQFLAAGPFVGAGLLTPFHHTRLGAYFGFFSGIIAGIVGIMVWFGWQREFLWDLRYVIGFTLMAVALGVVSVVQKLTANTRL